MVQEAARNMLNKPPNELGSVLSTASAFLAIFQDPIVSANTAYSDFNIKDLTNADHPCTLYICVNPESAQRLTPLIRLLFDFIGKKLTSDLYINKHRILFLIDEFPSLGRLSFFEKQLAFFRGYKIKCMLIAQSFNQLFSQYGERNSIIDNCKIKAILGVGSAQDAKLVSDTLGSYSINRETVSQSGTLGSIIARTRSTSYMETKRELMTVDEILRLPFENFILIKDGQFPYQGRKIMYYANRRFIPRVKLQTISTSHEQQREIPQRKLELCWIDDAKLDELRMVFAGPPERAIAQLHKQKLLIAREPSEQDSQAKPMPAQPSIEREGGKPDHRDSPLVLRIKSICGHLILKTITTTDQRGQLMSNTDNSKARRGRPPKLPLGARYHIYVDAQTAAQIQTFLAANASGHTSISISDLFVRAVRRYLKQEDTYWSLEFKMQEVLAKKFENLNTHVMVLSEIVLRFLDYWFALWPDRSQEEDQDSIDKSYRMMALFNSSLREILAAGGRLWELTRSISKT